MGATQSQLKVRERIEILKENNYIFIDSRGKIKTPTSHNCNINFFYCLRVGHIALQCPNKQAMIMKALSEIMTDEEVSDEEECPNLRMLVMIILSI